MLPEIITFNKTMQCRLLEYMPLFEGVETPCSEVTEVWRSIFEDLAIIKAGWQALWVLSEENCQKYDLLYPTAVIVHVEEFNWFKLTATVKVLAVQEDIVIPSTIKVPVIEFYPIKVQDVDEIELMHIGDWLDKCRYFFTNLWYPWDAKSNVTMTDWCESHLKNRLKMQYDIKNGVFDKRIANYLKLLLAEAQNITAISDKNYTEDVRLSVVRRYIRRKIIKTELTLFEEPDLRHGMILLKRKEKGLRNSAEEGSPEVKFVWMSGNCQSLVHCLGIAQSLTDNTADFKVFCSLQKALDSSSTNDIIIIPPGAHIMSSLSGIENGGSIKGILEKALETNLHKIPEMELLLIPLQLLLGLDKCESIILPDTAIISNAILFKCFGLIELENLTISKPNGIAIQVFGGELKLKNCRVISTVGKNSTARGIVVVSGSKLFLEECELEGFGTAIALQVGSCASVINTRIFNAYEGIKVTEKSSLSLENVVISSCSLFGIRVETSAVSSDSPLIGDLNILEENDLNCNITTKSVTFDGNGKGNVVVRQSESALNFEELLKADISHEVIYISDGEDSMEENSVEEIQLSFEKAL